MGSGNGSTGPALSLFLRENKISFFHEKRCSFLEMYLYSCRVLAAIIKTITINHRREDLGTDPDGINFGGGVCGGAALEL